MGGNKVVVVVNRPVKVVRKERTRVDVEIPGMPGPPGEQGDPGPPGPGAAAYILTASGPIGGQRVVAANVDGEAYYPDLTNPGDVANVVGITQNAAPDGGQVNVISEGEIDEVLWTWTPGPLFCSVTNGTLTQTAPLTGAVFEVARALSPTRIAVNLKTPTLRG